MVKTLQTSWLAGEVSPRIAQRFDIASYGASAEKLTNIRPSLEGALIRAPGSLVLDGLPAGTHSRAVRFKLSEEQSYIIVFLDMALRIYDAQTGKPVPIDPANESAGFDIETPYQEISLEHLYWTQQNSILIITHKSRTIKQRVLTRFNDGSWSLSEYETVSGPYQPLNFEEDIRIKADKVNTIDENDFITLTANTPFFDVGMNDQLIRLFNDNYGFPYDAWGADVELRDFDQVQSDGRVYIANAVNDGEVRTSRSPPVHEQGTVADRDIQNNDERIEFTYQHDGAGTLRIIEVQDDFTARAVLDPDLGNNLPERVAEGEGTNGFQLGSFSENNGYPALCGFFQQRLTLMGTIDQPDTFFMSFSQGFSIEQADFTPNRGNGEINDDHAIQRTMADGEINIPSWMIADDRLVVAMKNRLVIITGPTLDEPIVPAGANARTLQGVPGSSFICKGIRADAAICYASPSGRKLYALLPDFSYVELTVLARHIGHHEIVELAWEGEPYSRLWLRRRNGTLYCLVYELSLIHI